jgi:Uma2 family endonuclease
MTQTTSPATETSSVKTPTGGEFGYRNAFLTMQLMNWSLNNQTGCSFDSNTGFDLPNGAMRAPDASWVQRERLAALTPEQKKRFLPIAPDFVMELRSETDGLALLQEKMNEYISSGVRLGILIDPLQRKVHLYRPEAVTKILVDPKTVDCSPELPEFMLNLEQIFDAEI